MTDQTTNPPQGGKPLLGSDPSTADVNRFLAAFKTKIRGPDAPILPNPVSYSTNLARDAYWVGDWEAIGAVYSDPKTAPAAKAAIREMMLTEDAGLAAIAKDPKLAATWIAGADPDFLADNGVLNAFGSRKADVLGAALVGLALRPPADPNAPRIDRDAEMDPATFTLLAEELGADTLNDAGRGLGAPKRGLGPRVFASLMEGGGYGQICELIDLGVDTTIPAQSRSGDKGVHSDFVMPLQHLLQRHIRDTAKLGTPAAQGWDDAKRAKVQGVRQVLDKLAATGTAVSVTTWDAVKGSELLAAFRQEPGTIWGFEEMRRPYVQAAHEEKQGKRPLRMMELFEVLMGVMTAEGYEKLLDDPERRIQRQVAGAVDVVSKKIDTEEDYADVRAQKEEYLENLAEDGETFLREYASQIPRATFIRRSEDPSFDFVSKMAGIDTNKFAGSFACKAGLWHAKQKKRPIYYCLDGIDMRDVADYKKVKNKAIEEFLAEGGATGSKNFHKEVVTMKEVREILRNWDEFGEVIRFVREGEIMKGDKLEDFIAKWQQKMEQSNREAGRMPAPPRAEFEKELAKFDPGLPDMLDEAARLSNSEADVDQDARDIVRKAGYLVKVARANPDYVIKYLIAKCEVLVIYGLIDNSLVTAAASLGELASRDGTVTKAELRQAATAVESALGKCAPVFRDPLRASLLKRPLLKRSRNLKRLEV